MFNLTPPFANYSEEDLVAAKLDCNDEMVRIQDAINRLNLEAQGVRIRKENITEELYRRGRQ